MSLLQRLFGKKEPRKRIHICVECGMPVADHKEWCSILRTQREYDLKRAAAVREPALKANPTGESA